MFLNGKRFLAWKLLPLKSALLISFNHFRQLLMMNKWTENNPYAFFQMCPADIHTAANKKKGFKIFLTWTRRPVYHLYLHLPLKELMNFFKCIREKETWTKGLRQAGWQFIKWWPLWPEGRCMNTSQKTPSKWHDWARQQQNAERQASPFRRRADRHF